MADDKPKDKPKNPPKGKPKEPVVAEPGTPEHTKALREWAWNHGRNS